jgi:hypothetical protein
MLIFGAVLILAIVFMPNGIIGVVQTVWNKIKGSRQPGVEGGRRAPA